MAQLKFGKEIVVVAPLFLPQVGMCAPPRNNGSFDSGSAHSFDSGKNNGVLTLNVIRNRALKFCKLRRSSYEEI